jgi:hypothetical protein
MHQNIIVSPDLEGTGPTAHASKVGHSRQPESELVRIDLIAGNCHE